MELRDVLHLLRRRWTWIVVSTLVVGASATAFSAAMTPEYKASSEVFVSVRGGASATDLAQGNNFSQQRVASYVDVATSASVLRPVIDQLKLPVSVGELAGAVSASNASQTVLIRITATDPSAAQATAIANEVARSLIKEVTGIEGGAEKSLVQLSLIEEATAPHAPSSPSTVKNTAFGLVIGLLLGLGLAVLLNLLDTRVRRKEDVLAAGEDIAILGAITEESRVTEHPLLVLEEPHGSYAESTRQLRTHLQFTNLGGDRQVIVVTSTVAGEGKSSMCVSLALMLAQDGLRTLLVDADLRRPRIATRLGLEGAVGLTTLLAGRVELEDVIQPIGITGKLDVLPSGQVPPNPTEVLGSSQMAEAITYLKGEYDVIIIDAPPSLPVTDAAVLSQHATGLFMVASMEGKLRKQELADTIEKLSSLGVRLLGVVLNRVRTKSSLRSTYTYEPSQPATRRASRIRQRKLRGKAAS